MWLVAIILGVISWLMSGCYDLSFDPMDHTVDEFRVMAVSLSPPEVRADEPITAEVLYANPGGGAETVTFAWQVVHSEPDGHGGIVVDTAFGASSTGDARFDLAPIPEPLSDADEPLFADFEVFLCRGAMRDPTRVANLLETDIYTNLCKKGDVLAAVKRASMADPAYPQNNPQIDWLSLNGERLAPVGEHDNAVVFCSGHQTCSTSAALALYMTPESIETYSRTMTSSDGNEAISIIEERYHVEWYVSGGRLMFPSSGGSDELDKRGPYTNSWRPEASGRYALWAVLRDNRGGNSWRRYDIEVRTP